MSIAALTISIEASARTRKVLLGVSVVLIALNLRPVFSSLSVVLPEVMASTGLSATSASALATLPVICLGVFAMIAPWLGRRFGTERMVLACLLMILIGTLLRGTGSVPLLFAGTALAGIGIAISNVLLTALVKRDFAQQTALMMGLYTMAVSAGAAGGAGLTVPVEHALGGRWTAALAVWAVPAAVTALIWAPHALRRNPVPIESGRAVRGLWRDPLAWQVTGFMGLQSALFYAVMSWLAPILRERGLDAATAGYVVSVAVITQVVACIAVPVLAVKCRNQVGIAVGVSVLTLVALMGCMFAPSSGIWLWAVLLGIAQGGSFSLALTFIALRSRDSHVAAQLSGMAQGVGYLIAACGPMLVGLLRGWTGSFDASAFLFATIGIALVGCAIGAGRNRYVLAVTSRVHQQAL
jgi:CP family cyanate transporter-like MFS transporter